LNIKISQLLMLQGQGLETLIQEQE